MHKRQAIRERAVELLKGNTLCGERVFSNRGRPFFPSELPSITVYTESESSDFLNPPENRLKRTLTLIVECALMQDCHIDNEIDAACQEIEAVLKSSARSDSKFPGLIVESFLLNRTDIGLAEKGEKLMGSAKMTFQVEYESD